ncbi:uncharacterized protein LOC69369 isoform X4 [Mus musculus]|uniref:uncharacterized protein LOC69369 isoform X4 n=1 Tax=Mus musculus TaxID=10090 RepID=UPI0003D72E97|nr:uncharacterized protein LOC69369 isoform X4 [Mus musculus]|eukprot:XP_006527388.1 PREDICTED: uncharacterized protein LOC69369 isoform X4 [Mus musculus]
MSINEVSTFYIIKEDTIAMGHMFAIITNIISIFVAIFGLILLGYEFPIFESIGTEYIWSNMAGMMLLQISVMCAITELVIAILVLHWFITAHKIEEPSEEIFSGPSHSHLSSPPSTQPSMLELENVSEQSHPKDIEDENDVTN